MKQPPPVANRGRLWCRSGAAVQCYMNVAVRSCGTLQDIRLKEKCHLDYSIQVCSLKQHRQLHRDHTCKHNTRPKKHNPAQESLGLENKTKLRMLMATVATNWVIFLFLALTVHLSHTHKDLSSHRILVIHIHPTLMTNLKDMYTKWNHHKTLKYTKKTLSRHEPVNLIPPSSCSIFPSCHSSRTVFKVKHAVNTVKLWEAADRCVVSCYQSHTREQAAVCAASWL